MVQKAEDAGPGLQDVRVWLAVLLSLLLQPVAAASDPSAPSPTTPLGDLWAPLRSWQAHAADQEAVALTIVSLDAGYLDLFHLGDLDADGRAEVLVVEQEAVEDFDEPPLVRAAALKPMQDMAVWTLDAPEGGFLEALWDLQGDGVRDIIGLDYGGGMARFQDYVPAPVPVYAYDFDYVFNSTATFWSGRDAAALGDLEDLYAGSATNVGASAPFVGVSAAQGTDTGVFWSFVHGTTMLVADFQANVTSAYAYAAVTGQWMDAQDVDGTFTLRTLEGTTLASRAIAGPMLTPVAAAGLGSSDGHPRLAVAWKDGPQLVQLGIPADPTTLHVEVTDGDASWGFETEILPYADIELLGLPDLTGDGVGELEVLVYRLDAQELGDTVTTTIHDGSTGTVLGAVASATEFQYYIPFGDVDGDLVPELLQVRLGLDADTVEVGPTKADLKPLWTMALDDEFPVNFVADQLGLMGGFSDWSGDGAADLALVDEDKLELFDGVTGKSLWGRDLEEEQAVWTIGESTGTGQGDFAITWVTGVEDGEDDFPDGSKAVAGYLIGAGETGAALRTHILRDPTLIPAGPAGSDVRVVGVGDVDGDGRDEFGVIINDLAPDTIEWGDDEFEFLRGTPSAYIFALGRSDALWSRAAPTGGNDTSDLPTAAIVDAVRAPADEAPGLPVVLGLLALTAMAALRRRR